MFSKSKKFLVAILLASSAAAAPPKHVDSVHAVIDAIKSQLKAQNVPHADRIVDKSVAHLKDVGFLDDGMISDFNHEIAEISSEQGYSVDDIAEMLITELKAVDLIHQRDQEGVDKDALVIDPDLVKRVMARKVEAFTNYPPRTTQGTGFNYPS